MALVAITVFLGLSWPIAREATYILLQTVPAEMDTDAAGLKADLAKKFSSVMLGIHEFHVWSLVPGTNVATLHAKFASQEVRKHHKVGSEAKL